MERSDSGGDQGYKHGVRKHEQGVRKHVHLERTLVHGQHQPSIHVGIIQLYKYSCTQCITSAYLYIIMQLCKLYWESGPQHQLSIQVQVEKNFEKIMNSRNGAAKSNETR